MYEDLREAFTARFGGRLYYACPSGWPIYAHRGLDYHLNEDIADPEAVMKESLKQGTNLLIKTFPKVDLYPDLDAVY